MSDTLKDPFEGIWTHKKQNEAKKKALTIYRSSNAYRKITKRLAQRVALLDTTSAAYNRKLFFIKLEINETRSLAEQKEVLSQYLG